MADLKLHGTVEKVLKEIQISDTFKKRDVVLKTDADTDYPQLICVQFVQEMVDESGLLVQGMEISIDINLRGRAWQNPKDGETKYFNTLQGWKIETIGGLPDPVPTKPTTVGTPKMNGDMANEFNESQESSDDLPF